MFVYLFIYARRDVHLYNNWLFIVTNYSDNDYTYI